MGSIKRFCYALSYLCIAGIFFLIFHQYEKIENEQRARVIDELEAVIDQNKLTDRDIAYIQKSLNEHPEAVYLVIYDPLENHGVGYVNFETESHGSQYIKKMIVDRGMRYTFDSLKQMNQAPNEFVNIAQNYWVKSSLQVKYGYLNPVNHAQTPYLHAAVTYGTYIWYGLGLTMMIFHLLFALPGYAHDKAKLEQELDALDHESVEDVQDTNKEPIQSQQEQPDHVIIEGDTDEEGDDTNVDDIPAQVWIRLLEEPDLKDWDVQGNFYVRKDKKGLYAVGFPWGSSIVTRKEIEFQEYIYEAEGRILSGNEGFLVVFPVGRYQLVWVLGGWNNTRCEVMGYEQTRSAHKFHRRKWHHVRVEIEGEEVTGYIDGRTAWTLPMDMIVKSSPNVDMQEGLGVGVWRTTTKFRNIRVLKI